MREREKREFDIGVIKIRKFSTKFYCFMFSQKRAYYRVTTPFTRKPLLAEA